MDRDPQRWHERYESLPFHVSPLRIPALLAVHIGIVWSLIVWAVLLSEESIGNWPLLALAMPLVSASVGSLSLPYARRLIQVNYDETVETEIRKRRNRVLLWLVLFLLGGSALEFFASFTITVRITNVLPLISILALFRIGGAVLAILVLAEPMQKDIPPEPPAPRSPPPPREPRHTLLDQNATGLDDLDLAGDWDQAAHGRKKRKRKT